MGGDHGHSVQHGHGHNHGHGHGHGVSGATDRRLVGATLVLLTGLLLGEAIAGATTGSLALLSDAAHLLTDAGALAVALVTMTLAARPATQRWTYGLRRAEILSAAANGLTLVLIGLVILAEAGRRLIDPPAVQGGVVVVAAIAGCLVNVVATALLARANRSSLNVEGAYQHVLTDLFGFLGTLAAGLVVWGTGWARADALASLVVAGLMLRAGMPLVASAAHILLEGTPRDLDAAAVRAHLAELDGVRGVHDLHLWALDQDLVAVSAHVVVEEACFGAGRAASLLDDMQAGLARRFAVAHATLQLELPEHAAHELGRCDQPEVVPCI